MTLPSDVEQALRRHSDEVTRVARELSASETSYREHRRTAEEAVERALTALADAAVPSVEARELLALASQGLQLPAVEPDEVARELAQRRTTLEGRVTAVEADPRFSRAAERLSLLDTRSRELLEPIGHLRESVRALEQDEDFRAFAAHCDDDRWWTFSYHRTRAAGARALERHGKRRRVSDPHALVKKHREEREALATLEDELNAIGAERQALRALVDEHAEASGLLSTLEGTLLEELRAAVRAALRFLADPTLLATFPAPPLRALARQVSGCRARVRYLEALYLHHIERTRGALASHQQDVALMLTPATIARRAPPASALEVERETHRWTREIDEKTRAYRATAERLLGFTRWDECDPLAGQLWWDVLTGGSLDGSFIDEVAWHRTMGRPRGPTLPHARVDAKDGWARNAAHAMETLAAAAAELRAEKRDAPEPIELPDEEA